MKTKYFNKYEFNYAASLLETNPIEAKLRFEEYIKKYPKDYVGHMFYATALITLGEFSKAEEILDETEELLSSDKKVNNEFGKQKLNQREIISNRLRLLSYQEKYEELYYQFYQKYYQEINSMEMNPLIFLCKKKLGLLNQNRRANHTYIFRQIVNYEESDFLDHIQKHFPDYNQNEETPNISIFYSDFPLTEILTEVRKYLLSDIRLYSNFYVDTYIFKYNNCGRVENKITDYFRVVCFHNTTDIITIYPVTGYTNIPYIDLNYLAKEKTPKVKTLSRIDKFNQRYGISKK